MRRTAATLGVILVAFVAVMLLLLLTGCRPTSKADHDRAPKLPAVVENSSNSTGNITAGGKTLKPGQKREAAKVCLGKKPATWVNVGNPWDIKKGELGEGKCLSLKRGDRVTVTVVNSLKKVRA